MQSRLGSNNNETSISNMAVDVLMHEHDLFSNHIQKLEQAINILKSSDSVTGGFRSRNSSFRNRQNIDMMSSTDQNSSNGVSSDDIDPSNIKWDKDGRGVDLRTIEGKTLLADGLVDSQGVPTDTFPEDFYPSNIGKDSRGRGYSSSERDQPMKNSR